MSLLVTKGFTTFDFSRAALRGCGVGWTESGFTKTPENELHGEGLGAACTSTRRALGGTATRAGGSGGRGSLTAEGHVAVCMQAAASALAPK